MLFGTSKVVPMGPTAIVALLIGNTIGNRGPVYATLLCLITGVVQALMSFAGLGVIVNFISVPVCSGFTSAAAILIIVSQVKDLLGVRGSGGNLLKMVKTLLEHVGEFGAGDAIMGFGCVATAMLLKVTPVSRQWRSPIHSPEIDHTSPSREFLLCGFFWLGERYVSEGSENPGTVPLPLITVRQCQHSY